MKDQRPEYGRLIALITDRMIRVVWRIVRGPDEAEDAFQEALLTVWTRWGQIQSHPNPHAECGAWRAHAPHVSAPSPPRNPSPPQNRRREFPRPRA